MAKKVNGIKIYPRYAVGSILASVFDIVSAVIIIFACFLMPAFTIGNVSMTGVDFAAASLDKILPSESFVSIVENLHFFNPETFDISGVTNQIASCVANSTLSYNLVVAWFSLISDYVFYAIGFSCLISLVFAVCLLITGLIRLILGTYPKGSKVLCILSSLPYLLFLMEYHNFRLQS